MLALLEVSKDEYEAALSISEDKDFQLHLKTPQNSCFVNNYFSKNLLAWVANLDIQPLFNHYKAVTYMCAYLSKCEYKCSQAMSQAVKKAFEHNLEIKSVAHTYVTMWHSRVCISYFSWCLGKTFPRVIFVNSNLPEKRYRMCLNRHF